MTWTNEAIETALGHPLFDYQAHALKVWRGLHATRPRLCLYYRTGAGKTLTALILLAQRGVQQALVIAPPLTHSRWVSDGRRLGIEVTAISHAKFRQPGYLAQRNRAVVADEVHLFGGHDGKGWKKLDRLAKGLQAPLIVASATPNYNDAERVYCIEHILSPQRVAGGFIQFLYRHCVTEQNHFGATPLVTGFLHHQSAAQYLAALPEVVYVPDDIDYSVVDIPLQTPLPDELTTYGVDVRTGRIIASQIEARHKYARYRLLDENNRVRPHVMDMLTQLVGEATTPVLIFCASSKVAEALYTTCLEYNADVALVTGDTSATTKHSVITSFRIGMLDVLIGTATLATGTDGLDKICDTLIIVHDTDDDSLRRQLIGRIMPRGEDTDATKKKVLRLVVTS